MRIIKIFKKSLLLFIIGITIFFFVLLIRTAISVIKIPNFSKNINFLQLEGNRVNSIQFIPKDIDNSTQNPLIDSNLIVINIETHEAYLKRKEIASVIRFLKDAGAKTIAMNIALDISSSQFDPLGDIEFSQALKYANNVIVINALNISQNENGDYDTTFTLQPLPIFDSVLAGQGYANLDPPYGQDNPGAIVQYFYPNSSLKGETKKSFAVSVVQNYDSSKVLGLTKYTDKIYNNFYPKSAFTIWDLSLLINPETRVLFQDFVKNRLFIFGYINPEDDPLKTSMFNTPIGKIDYVLVYAGIISDFLKSNYRQIYYISNDYLLGLGLILINIIYFSFTRNRQFKFKFILNLLLLPLELGILSLILIVSYFYFNILINMIIPIFSVFLSIPLGYLIFYVFEIHIKKIVYSRLSHHYPYFLHKCAIEPYKYNNNYVRFYSIIHNFKRIFLFIEIITNKKINENKTIGRTDTIIKNNNEFIRFKSYSDLKDFNKNIVGNEFHTKIFLSLISVKRPEIINQSIFEEYEKIFSFANLNYTIMKIADDTSEKIMNALNLYSLTYHEIINSLSGYLSEYKLVYISNKTENKYLIRIFENSTIKSKYIFNNNDLNKKEMYLYHKNEFLNLNPHMVYKFCPFHNKKEIFVLSETIADLNSIKRFYLGDNFSCRLEINTLIPDNNAYLC